VLKVGCAGLTQLALGACGVGTIFSHVAKPAKENTLKTIKAKSLLLFLHMIRSLIFQFIQNNPQYYDGLGYLSMVFFWQYASFLDNM
jgi:hypothetical protein